MINGEPATVLGVAPQAFRSWTPPVTARRRQAHSVPMQFMPSTWQAWRIDAFGQTGPPDIMNSLDAVPSSARTLRADGAAHGGASLSAAIFDYKHASWYVHEVLGLASEYAREYP